MATVEELARAPKLAQRLASDPRASAWVDASAGTGKTKVLTDRVLRLLLGAECGPVAPSNILCLTFTKAAAAEMSNRLHESLAEWATLPDAALAEKLADLTGEPPEPETTDAARRLLIRVLDAPGGMRIQTIHAFCQALLARFPLEAAVPPHFEVIDERTADELMAAVQEEVISRIEPEADDPLANALATVTRHIHELHFPELMAELARERGRLARLTRKAGGRDALIDTIWRRLELAADTTPDDVLMEAASDDNFDRDGLAAAAAALAAGSKTDQRRSGIIRDWLALSDAASRAAAIDEYGSAFLTKKGVVLAKLATKSVAENAPPAIDTLTVEAERLAAMQEDVRRATVADATAAILTLGNELLATFESHKRAHGWLDYDDLIIVTRDLLTMPGRAAWVLYKLDGGIDHILVDEAQDTNPEQWELIAAIADEFFAGVGAREKHRTVFAVGDPKQSIYSFQRADPREFAKMRGWFAQRVQNAEHDWREIPLETSFRSTRAILDAVDAVFARDAAQDGLLFDARPVRHQSNRKGQAGRVEIWPADEPQDDDPPEAWKPPIERTTTQSAQSRLAARVSQKIADLCDGQEVLPSHDRPIGPGDIMVLVRRRNAFLDELVRRLKERRVPVAGIDRLVLADHIAVMDMISLGRFLLLPSDDLSLAEALKSPLFGFDDDDLFAIAYGRDDQTLWQSLAGKRDRDPKFEAAHETLANLLATADFRSPYELYADLLGARGARRHFLARLGLEAIDPLDEFLSQALAYERAHVPSLQGFLHWLETGAVEVKRDLDVGTAKAVRVMTVHGSKGLQSPIVFLPDTLQLPRRSPRLAWSAAGDAMLWPPRENLRDSLSREWIDEARARQAQEYRRLLYVAMTRAADRLYVCGWRNRTRAPENCWYNLIQDALADHADVTRLVDPLAVASETGEPQTILRLDSTQTNPPDTTTTRREEPPIDDAPAWVRTPPPPEPAPPIPLVPSKPAVDAPPARSPLAPEDRRAAERGRLIHRLLQSLPDVPVAERRAACDRFLDAAATDLDSGAREDIATAALNVLHSDEFAPVFAPGSLAEVPIAGLLPGSASQILSGQIDRLAVSDTSVLAIDYKTNQKPPSTQTEVPEAYLRQMASYRAGLQAIFPDRTVRCALVWTEGPNLMSLDDQLLDRFAPNP